MNGIMQLASLTAKQREAFYAASGRTVTAADLNSTILGVYAFLLMLWLAWVITAQYKMWVSEKTSLQEVGASVLRASLIVITLIALVSWSRSN